MTNQNSKLQKAAAAYCEKLGPANRAERTAAFMSGALWLLEKARALSTDPEETDPESIAWIHVARLEELCNGK